MSKNNNFWIFSNNPEGSCGGENSVWDITTILESNKYYFAEKEGNRAHVKKGDRIILRTYGIGFWGDCLIADNWVQDSDGKNKFKIKTGWFPITGISRWKATLPYEIICDELSNKNHRARISRIDEGDKDKINLALKTYLKLGYGSTDGDFFILENGIEEAVKKNISQLKLKLAGPIQEQCVLGKGIGRTDLICKDEEGNYVVLELKTGTSSDEVIGQISRYMGYVRERWAMKEQKDVRGIILIPGYDEKLRLAAKEANIKVLRIRIK